MVGVVVPILVAVGLAGFFFWQWQRTQRPVAPTRDEMAQAPAEVEGAADEAEAPGVEASPSAEPGLRAYSFAVRNGAGISGIAGQFAKSVKEKLARATVVETTNAQKSDYEESRLVSFVDDRAEAEGVAAVLGIALGDLPEDEAQPEADFLVIVGRDQE